MEKNKKNEELQSRREFFKKAAKGALPILGAIVLANAPVISKAAEESMGCNGGCLHSCGGVCSNGCHITCLGDCKGSCEQSCYRGCKNTCHGTCSGGCARSAYA